MLSKQSRSITVPVAALAMAWVTWAVQPAAAQPPGSSPDVPNMIINPNFDQGLKGWLSESSIYPFPEGIFDAEANVTIGPASPATSNRWAEMNVRARAEVGDATQVAGGQVDLVLYQSFEYDHNSVLPVIRHDGLVGTTSLVITAVLTEDAKANLTVMLELENTRTGQVAFTNVANFEVLGPCPDEPIATVSGFRPWGDARVMASMVDAVEGDKLIARARVHLALEATGAGSAASVMTQTRVDRMAIVEISEEEALIGTATQPMFSTSRSQPADDVDRVTFADLADALSESFAFDATIEALAEDIIGFSTNSSPTSSATAARAVPVTQLCPNTEGAACGPIIIESN